MNCVFQKLLFLFAESVCHQFGSNLDFPVYVLEVVVSVAAVTVLGCTVAVEPHSEHLTSLLSSPHPPVPLPGLRVDTGQSWVLSASLQYLEASLLLYTPVFFVN